MVKSGVADFEKSIKDILDSLKLSGADLDSYAAHYTSSNVPVILLKDKDSNKIRQYSGDYVNDPSEGRYLIDVKISAAQKSEHPEKGAFVETLSDLRTSRLLFSAYKRATFFSCWTLTKVTDKNRAVCDSLNHWRFYGEDGKGASIMVPASHLSAIFNNEVFKVVYGTEPRGGGSVANVRPVKLFMDALVKVLNSLGKTKNKAKSEFEEVLKASHPLLFLFKSSEYNAEKEVRTIIHTNGYSEKCGVHFDDRNPQRAYVDGGSGLLSNEAIVFFGPKSDTKWAIHTMGLASDRELVIDVFVSTKPYR